MLAHTSSSGQAHVEATCALDEHQARPWVGLVSEHGKKPPFLQLLSRHHHVEEAWGGPGLVLGHSRHGSQRHLLLACT